MTEGGPNWGLRLGFGLRALHLLTGDSGNQVRLSIVVATAGQHG